MYWQLKHNWFWPLAALLLTVVFTLARRYPAQIPYDWEYAVLFDVLVSLPLLFLICYRKQMATKAMALRIVALQCLGIWLATKIVPVESQSLLPSLWWLRNLGIAVLFLFELRLAVALFKIVFKPETTAEQLQETGMPRLLAKAALVEARFWRWVIGLLKR